MTYASATDARKSMSIVMLGQAPSRDGDPRYPCTGRPMHVLCKVIGDFHYMRYLFCFMGMNVIDRWPGYKGGGDDFPIKEAREAFVAKLPHLKGRRVIAWGSKVGEVLGWDGEYMSWQRYGGGCDFDYAVIPHPSGRNRWYNSEENRNRLRSFLRDALEKLRTDFENTGYPNLARRADLRPGSDKDV